MAADMFNSRLAALKGRSSQARMPSGPPPPASSTAAGGSKPAAKPFMPPGPPPVSDTVANLGAINRPRMAQDTPPPVPRPAAQPSPMAMQQANANASFQRPVPDAATMEQRRTAMKQPRPAQPVGGVTSADMVDVPGIGMLPRSLLSNLLERYKMKTGQQTDANLPVRAMPVGTPYGNDSIGTGVPNMRPFEPPEKRFSQPPMQPGDHPINPLSGEPLPGLTYAGPVQTAPTNSQVQAPAPPPPPPAPPPPAQGPRPSDSWMAEHGHLLNPAFQAAQAAARFVPPPPPPSPLPNHVWGGGPEAMGAGRNPMITSMTDFYGAYGMGHPGMPLPTQQQIYDRFNANADPNPFMRAGPADMRGPTFVAPSWY